VSIDSLKEVEERMNVVTQPPAGLGRRFKVRFPDADHYNAAQAFETAESRVPVRSAKRNFISVELPPALRGISAVENTLTLSSRPLKSTLVRPLSKIIDMS
jgi:hypothetical protein